MPRSHRRRVRARLAENPRRYVAAINGDRAMTNDNLKMFGRYGLAIVTSYAVGKGWLSQPAAGLIGDFVIQAVGLGAASVPAIYAALKVNNAPKP